jgi:hypothetical protein
VRIVRHIRTSLKVLRMETMLQIIIVVGTALSLYGSVQLATRIPAGTRLAPFWHWLYLIVVRGTVPPESGGGSAFLYPVHQSTVGWRCLIAGFSLQVLGNALLPLWRLILR